MINIYHLDMVSKGINWSIYHLLELVHPRTEDEYVILLVYLVKKNPPTLHK